MVGGTGSRGKMEQAMMQRKESASAGTIAKPFAVALLVIGLVVLAMVGFTVARSLPQSFTSLAGSESFSVSSIEMMQADHAPVTYKVDEDSETLERLNESLKAADCVFKEDEIGMSLEDTLYTLRLSGADSEMANFSFSADGLVHDNRAEKTYELSDKGIYDLCKELYLEAEQSVS